MRYLVIGGAGFIGSNLSAHLSSQGEEVVIFDNLSRKGTNYNLAWLQENYNHCHFAKCDIRNQTELQEAYKTHRPFDVVIHLAGQVAVTTSVMDPRTDFDINAAGTFNVLELLRQFEDDPIFIFSSTNKVYGEIAHAGIIENETRYEYVDYPNGIDETCSLDFHSPYGCSKGCADQYVHDYARIYGLKTVVFRQSAIYGPRQFGVEDQGWAAWFTISSLKGDRLNIYGDGKQVRDLLWVEDLINAYLKAIERIDTVRGEIFNIGGGPERSVSIWHEFGPILEKEIGSTLRVDYKDWRPGDQKVCIMDIQKAKTLLNWEPKVNIEEGTAKLVQWVKDNLSIL